jgi:hypothetical protein
MTWEEMCQHHAIGEADERERCEELLQRHGPALFARSPQIVSTPQSQVEMQRCNRCLRWHESKLLFGEVRICRQCFKTVNGRAP